MSRNIVECLRLSLRQVQLACDVDKPDLLLFRSIARTGASMLWVYYNPVSNLAYGIFLFRFPNYDQTVLTY